MAAPARSGVDAEVGGHLDTVASIVDRDERESEDAEGRRLEPDEVEITPPPRLGEHTDEVLSAELGLDENALEGLRETGVIGNPARFN